MDLRIVVSIAALMALTPLSAQERQERTQRDATTAFIERKTSEQRNFAQRSAAPNELRELNGLVRAIDVVLPNPQGIDDAEQIAAIRDLYLTDLAQGLQNYGFRPGDLRSASDDGKTIVLSMGRVLRGSAAFEDYLTLADTVVLARKLSEANSDLNDEHLSSLVFEVITPIKNAPQMGNEITVRRRSGSTADGRSLLVSNEIPLPDGETFLLVGSRSNYANEYASRQNGCRNCIVEVIPVLYVEGDVAISTSAPGFEVNMNDLIAQ